MIRKSMFDGQNSVDEGTSVVGPRHATVLQQLSKFHFHSFYCMAQEKCNSWKNTQHLEKLNYWKTKCSEKCISVTQVQCALALNQWKYFALRHFLNPILNSGTCLSLWGGNKGSYKCVRVCVCVHVRIFVHLLVCACMCVYT